MKDIDVDVVTRIMAECVAQEHEIDDMIAYLDAASVFMPAVTDDLTNEQVVALEVITKYHQKQRRRLVESKEKIHERFSYARADYMELINQAKAKHEPKKESEMNLEKFPGLTLKHFTLYANSKEQGIGVNGHEWFYPVIEKPDKKMSILYRNGIFVFEFPDKDGCQTYDDTIKNYGREVLREAVRTALQAVVDQIPEQHFTGDEIVSGFCYPDGKVICTTKADFVPS